MKLNSLHDLLINHLKDIYSAENQIVKKGLPPMIKASEGELKKGFEKHLKQTEEQIKRLEKIGEILEIKLSGKVCHGMEGIISEAAEDLEENPEGSVAIAALTSAAQKVEHYEIANYEAAIMLCEKMGHDDVIELLQETLDEENETSDILTEIAEEYIEQEEME